jgi:mannose-6-phosphate isomerase
MSTPTSLHAPIVLPVSQIDHFYLGGDRIGALRSGPGGPRRPEEWLGSTVTRHGEAERGRTRLPNGELLHSLIVADPEAWLGPKHAARYGADPAVLVKLLDAGERLPVHVHPTRRFAQDHLDCDYGKTEAWVVLETPADGAPVWVGCKHDVDPATLRALVDKQDKAALVACLNQIIVYPGDAVLVPSGTPHCTGAGAFVLELQEPTDFSVLLEWDGFALDGPAEGHLGLGFETALECVNRRAFTPARLEELVRRNGPPRLEANGVSLLPTQADPYFRALRVHTATATTTTTTTTTTTATVAATFAIVVVTAGTGVLETRVARTPLRRGTAVVVPYAAGDMAFRGEITALVALPPSPYAPLPHEFDA